MGVYIPNIEMPKTCGECELRALDEWEDEYCVILRSDILVPYERMLECPLIEIVTCSECKCLEVINGAKIYAHCPMWEIDFKPFEDDTRTNYCSWGERRAE